MPPYESNKIPKKRITYRLPSQICAQTNCVITRPLQNILKSENTHKSYHHLKYLKS